MKIERVISIFMHADNGDCPMRLGPDLSTPAHSGSASAMYSLGMSSHPTVTTMYCRPSTM